MRLKQLFIWITLTALLQCSGAQEEEEEEHNIPINVSEEKMEMATTEMPVIEKEVTEENIIQPHPTTEVVNEMTQPALPPELEEPAVMVTKPPEILMPVESTEVVNEMTQPDLPPEQEEPAVMVTKPPEILMPVESTLATEKHDDEDPEPNDYQNEEPQQEVTNPPTTTLRIPTLPPLPLIPTNPPINLNIPTLPPMPKLCYSCTSALNGTCQKNPTKRLECPSKPANRNGCFTLVKRDSKLIMRGCIAELSEEDNKFCTNDNNKYCQLCYELACNEKEAIGAGGANLVIWTSSLLAVSFSLISGLI